MQNVDIWVSDGDLNSPFYKFYTDVSGTNEVQKLVFSSTRQYTFRRLNQASSHPFYMRQSGSDTNSMQTLIFSGKGTISNGIIREEAFTVRVVNPDSESLNVEYFCTSHPSMKGQIIFRSDTNNLAPSATIESDISAISRLYTAAFGRKPDEGGLQFWINVVNDPVVSYKDVSKSFVDSPEFSAIVSPDSSGNIFVAALYRNVLGRAPDSEGLSFWTNQFESGLKDRADILIGFANSAENVALYETLA